MKDLSNHPSPLQALLDQALEFTRANESHFYIFDIDSTLLDVSPRIQKILHDFLALPSIIKNYSDLLARMDSLTVEPTDWGIRHAFERLKIPDVPESFIEKAKDFWREHFFANTYLPFDTPYDGAVEFVQKLHLMGHHIFYLTGRDVHRMGTGTIESLQQHQFPVSIERAQLILKPEKSMQDNLFKKDWIENLVNKNPNGKFLFFENEPVNIEAVRHLYPKVKVIFIQSTHSGRLEDPTDLPKINNYKLKHKN